MDECDITLGLDTDCNGNGTLDRCDILPATAADTNLNCTPDSCEYAIGDLLLDEAVGSDDLAFLLNAWGTTHPLADLSGNGVVDGADAAILLNNWGATPFECGNCSPLPWATVLEYFPDETVVINSILRSELIATGLPWRVRDNTTQIEMMLIAPGSIPMGCSWPTEEFMTCSSWTLPVHQVTLTNAYYMGRYEVTQAQWLATMGSNPSSFQGASFPNATTRPVETVSWNSVQSFLANTTLRLPTEAEWEFACRAGVTTPFYATPAFPNGFAIDSQCVTIAWYETNAKNQTHVVGGLLPNGFGLYDTLGNVWEWVNDWWALYSSAPKTNPSGPTSGTERVMRGGSWSYFTAYVNCESRTDGPATGAYDTVGFRVARNPF